ncbi:ferredoxin-NADP reductase [Phyllobacterium ifriqiyense]|uniref:Ferredoxin-NADP reductase n=1 Tax=Phyllobacterium ifriqiyense TaxID=314238 RepID=A0ABU0S5Y2_9HYPH|nr:FAD-binding oxidoreductase [Phyllobacterium ifriqiyense]MDQ0996144.1 ferredoxin-NADP reductase [Phyllobacterium ifriqiyense]
MTDISSVWQTASISGIYRQTKTIKSFFLALREPFFHIAGQFVDVRLTAPNGYQAVRSYSIASAPNSNGMIEIAIDRLEDGEVSSFFHDVALVGDLIEIRGPLGGHFTMAPNGEGPVLLVGGGSGAVPLVAMVRQRVASGKDQALSLLVSAKTWDDVVFRDEILSISKAIADFTFTLTLTRASTATEEYFNRRIDAAIIKVALDRLPSPPEQVYVCGSNDFVNSAVEQILKSGVNALSIRTERFGG